MTRLTIRYPDHTFEALLFDSQEEAQFYLDCEISIPGVEYSITDKETGKVLNEGFTSESD